MRILLTNDDGIAAAGLNALAQSLAADHEIYVAAPAVEQSAKSQAITIHDPVRVDEYNLGANITAWKIGGTPVDCVKLALESLLPKQPDLIISGINRGPNLGTDVLYSGTVGAALEGGLKGIMAAAISVDTRSEQHFGAAAAFAAELVRRLANGALTGSQVLNINIPEQWQIGDSVAITSLGQRDYANVFQARQDPAGRTYYWLGGRIIDLAKPAGTDIAAAEQGQATITPLKLELTDFAALSALKDWWEQADGN